MRSSDRTIREFFPAVGMLDEFELVRWHCKGKPAHKAKASHKPQGCAPVKAKKAVAKAKPKVAAPVRKAAVRVAAARPAAAPVLSGAGGQRMVR